MTKGRRSLKPNKGFNTKIKTNVAELNAPIHTPSGSLLESIQTSDGRITSKLKKSSKKELIKLRKEALIRKTALKQEEPDARLWLSGQSTKPYVHNVVRDRAIEVFMTSREAKNLVNKILDQKNEQVINLLGQYKVPDMQVDDFTIVTVFPPTSNPFLRLWRWLFGTKHKRKILTRPPERRES